MKRLSSKALVLFLVGLLPTLVTGEVVLLALGLLGPILVTAAGIPKICAATLGTFHFGGFVTQDIGSGARDERLSATDSGASFTNRTTVDGVVAGSVIYVGTIGGLSFSISGAVSFVNRTTANGLGSNDLQAVWVQ